VKGEGTNERYRRQTQAPPSGFENFCDGSL
jgi:hypothetical protein